MLGMAFIVLHWVCLLQFVLVIFGLAYCCSHCLVLARFYTYMCNYELFYKYPYASLIISPVCSVRNFTSVAESPVIVLEKQARVRDLMLFMNGQLSMLI